METGKAFGCFIPNITGGGRFVRKERWDAMEADKSMSLCMHGRTTVHKTRETGRRHWEIPVSKRQRAASPKARQLLCPRTQQLDRGKPGNIAVSST